MLLKLPSCFLFSLFLWLHLTVVAQQPKCKSIKGNLSQQSLKNSANNSRSDSVDILNYSISLNITNFTTKIISGSCKVRFQTKLNGISYLDLDLLKLTVDSIKQHDTLVASSYNDTLLKLNLLHPLALSAIDSVTVYYHGVPQIDATGWGGFYFTPTYAYNLGVGFGADPHNYGRVWFPCFDNFVERSSYDFAITVSAGRKAACNGYLKNHVVNPNTTETWFWQLYESIPTYLVGIAIASYKTVQQSYNGLNGIVPVELHAIATDTTNVKNSFVHLEDAFHTYEAQFGAYSWNKVGYSFVPFTGGAMEHATNVTYPRAFATGNLTYESIMAHEFSHHWWGNLVTCKTAEDMWINEGMASYCENLFTEAVYGKTAYLAEVRSNLKEILQFTHHKEGGFRAVSGVPHEYTYSDHVYLKGKTVGHSLRGYMGDSLYFSSMKTFLNNRKFSAVSSADMRDELETAGGLNLHSFFDNWVFSPGFPHFSIDSTRSQVGGLGYTTQVYLKQKLYGAPNLYNDVPLEITFFDSAWVPHTEQVYFSGLDSAYSFSHLFYPVYTAVNFNQKISDAISSESKTLKTTGVSNFANALMSLTVQAISDSVFLRIEHNWAAPDSLVDVSKHYLLSPNRYWKVDGITNPGFVASARINYDGRTISFAGNSYLDHNLISGKEDSLILLYRPGAGYDWTEYSSYTKTMGNVNDKTGSMTLDSIKKGEYVLAMKNALLASSPLIEKAQRDYRIYPNPAGNKVNIELRFNTNNKSDIDIYDSNLRLYENYSVDGNQNTLTISSSDWPNGIYFVIITHHITQQTIMQKVIINHDQESVD
jgi:aminopeptidase N